ncbi:MAG: hypothetical protein IJ391_02435 [Clostridia bacterium]|nr:hypothetical protein [Clostridia bacterium]
MSKKKRKNEEERSDYDYGFEKLKNADPNSSETIAALQELFMVRRMILILYTMNSLLINV